MSIIDFMRERIEETTENLFKHQLETLAALDEQDGDEPPTQAAPSV